MIPNIYCMMKTGKPLTDEVRQVLLINACDMADARRKQQEIKGRGYHGIIKSDLESVNFAGISIVMFEADIVCSDVGMTKVEFGVRTTDIDEGVLSLGKWSNFEDLVKEIAPNGNPEWN